MRESAIERRLVVGVKNLGGKAYKLMPSEGGLPDRLCVFPGGRIVFVELKAPGGRVARLQAYQHRVLKHLGAEVRVLASVEAVDSFLEKEASRLKRGGE